MAESDPGQSGKPTVRERFHEWSEAELRAHASDLGIGAAARMNREQLVEAIRDREARVWVPD